MGREMAVAIASGKFIVLLLPIASPTLYARIVGLAFKPMQRLFS